TAGKAIKITGKVIEYGGKIVFAGIEWNEAKKVKSLIKEAQAGNPVARIQLMEDSSRCAKMYIAVLAREGHPLATEFIVKRGYTEADFNDATSLKIIREAMMSSA